MRGGFYHGLLVAGHAAVQAAVLFGFLADALGKGNIFACYGELLIDGGALAGVDGGFAPKAEGVILLQLLGEGVLGVGILGKVFKHGRAHFKAVEPRMDDDLAKQPDERRVV